MKDRMVRAAAELFHRQGLGATSPDEIFRAAGAEGQNFYYHFKSKQGVVHAVLRCYLRAIETAAAPINYEVHSWQDLESWFNAQIELQRSFRMSRSCPFGTTATGVTENDELIRQDLNLIFDLVAKKLTAFFEQEKANGNIPKRISGGELSFLNRSTS